MFHNIQIPELIGYFASVLVAVSLMMSAVVKLRVINLIGAVCFTIYGILISAYPVAIVNGFITIVDLYYLINILTEKEYFGVLEVYKDSDYLNYFLKFHEKDIKKFIPAFSFQIKDSSLAIFILRNSIPAGLLYGEFKDKNSLFIKLDYAIPRYRDFKTGRYAINKLFKEKSIKNIYSNPGNKAHEKYLRRLGFLKTQIEGEPIYHIGNN